MFKMCVYLAVVSSLDGVVGLQTAHAHDNRVHRQKLLRSCITPTTSTCRVLVFPPLRSSSRGDIKDATIVDEKKFNVGRPMKKWPPLKELAGVVKDSLWGVVYFAATAFILLGVVPVVGAGLVATTFLSFLIGGLGLLTAGLDFGLLSAFQFALVASVLFAVFPFAGATLLFFPATALLVVGAGMLLTGLAQLGPALFWPSKPRPDHELQTSGVYRVMRHPIYGGLLLSSLGVAGLTNSATQAALTLMLFPILRSQVSVEEGHLRDRYGEMYAEYAADVPWALLPFVVDMADSHWEGD